MNSGALKSLARDKLKEVYIKAALGMLICYIPVYMFSLLTTIMIERQVSPVVVLLIATLIEFFVTDIFTVGYMRSLFDLNRQSDNKRYDANIVLSGFSNNYLNTLKTMFLRRLYVFGWGMIVSLPIIAVICYIIASEGAGNISEQYAIVQNLPDENAVAIIIDIMLKYEYLIIGGAIAALCLLVLYIRKVYLYEMIPMIIAENPELPSKEAFAKTKAIMEGYRFRYFLLILSFIGILILLSLIVLVIPYTIVQYIVMAAIMPYINMTLLQFYLWRTKIDSEERND